MAAASSPLVPKLRFPEFRDGTEWELRKLSSVGEVNPPNDELPGLPELFIYIDLESVKSGILVERKEITRDAAPSRAQRLLRCKDIIFQTVRPYQRNNLFFAINDENESKYVASTGYAQLRAHESPEFLYQLLYTDSFMSSVLARCTGSNYPAINPSALASIKVAMPLKSEQQKIADCLGSLDDLIAAVDRKLDALRQHKQGLMQKLFPQPGETLPRWRFPEFRDGPAWSISPLDSICEVLNKRRIPITMKDRTTGPYPYYGASGIVDYVKDFIFDERLILVGEDGAKWGPFEETAFIAEGKYWVNNHAHVLRSIGLIDLLLQAYLVRSDLGCYVTGAAPPKLTLGKLKAIPIPIPPSPAEQRKIADCLGSLDDLIAAEDRKLEALRQHKQGLMQQLFPSLDGQ